MGHTVCIIYTYWGTCSVAETFSRKRRPPGHNAASSMSSVSSWTPSRSWSKSKVCSLFLLCLLILLPFLSLNRSRFHGLDTEWSGSIRCGYPSSFRGNKRFPWLRQAFRTYFSLSNPDNCKKEKQIFIFPAFEKKISQNISINILGQKSLYYYNSVITYIWNGGKTVYYFGQMMFKDVYF